MAFTDALTVIGTNLTTAAADVTGRTFQVLGYSPDTVNKDTLVYWHAGTTYSHTGGETFTKVNLEHRVSVIGYLWTGTTTRSATNAAAIETDANALQMAIWNRLMADRDCGGNAIGLWIEDDKIDLDWVDFAGQICRTVELTLLVDMAEEITSSL